MASKKKSKKKTRPIVSLAGKLSTRQLLLIRHATDQLLRSDEIACALEQLGEPMPDAAILAVAIRRARRASSQARSDIRDAVRQAAIAATEPAAAEPAISPRAAHVVYRERKPVAADALDRARQWAARGAKPHVIVARTGIDIHQALGIVAEAQTARK